jgi:hypothetical protein
MWNLSREPKEDNVQRFGIHNLEIDQERTVFEEIVQHVKHIFDDVDHPSERIMLLHKNNRQVMKVMPTWSRMRCRSITNRLAESVLNKVGSHEGRIKESSDSACCAQGRDQQLEGARA